MSSPRKPAPQMPHPQVLALLLQLKGDPDQGNLRRQRSEWHRPDPRREALTRKHRRLREG